MKRRDPKRKRENKMREIKLVTVKIVPPLNVPFVLMVKSPGDTNGVVINAQVQKQVDIEFDYRAQLLRMVESPMTPGSGVTKAELRKSLPLLDKIEQANGSLLLEDEEWDYLKQKMANASWAFVHRALLEFEDAIENAPKVEVAVKKAEASA